MKNKMKNTNSESQISAETVTFRIQKDMEAQWEAAKMATGTTSSELARECVKEGLPAAIERLLAQRLAECKEGQRLLLKVRRANGDDSTCSRLPLFLQTA